jgi:SAM-dependent methyltransferase
MLPALSHWLASPRGQALLAAETALVGDALEDVFGWEMIQVGAWGAGQELLARGRTRRKLVVHGDPGRLDVDVVGRLTQLPLASDSIDAVILPHTLEFEHDPYAVLREVDRVLTGEGKLVVLGLRPWSFWGLRAVGARGTFPPGLRRLLSERRLRDWLVLLGYEVAQSRHFLFESPWGEPSGSPRALRRGLWYPWPAGGYLLKACKRVYATPPLRLRLRERAQVIGGLAKPSVNRGPP